MKYTKVIVMTAAIVFLAAGCNSADNTMNENGNANSEMSNMGNGNANTTTNVNANTMDTMPPQSVSKVEIMGFKFAPATITVKKGTTVTWTNQDEARHNVVAQGLNASTGPKSELFGKGESYSYTFDTVGEYMYLCEPHPNMIGTVVVTE